MKKIYARPSLFLIIVVALCVAVVFDYICFSLVENLPVFSKDSFWIYGDRPFIYFETGFLFLTLFFSYRLKSISWVFLLSFFLFIGIRTSFYSFSSGGHIFMILSAIVVVCLFILGLAWRNVVISKPFGFFFSQFAYDENYFPCQLKLRVPDLNYQENVRLISIENDFLVSSFKNYTKNNHGAYVWVEHPGIKKNFKCRVLGLKSDGYLLLEAEDGKADDFAGLVSRRGFSEII